MNSGRLSSAVENKSREDILPLCVKLVEALNSALIIDAVKERVFVAINDVLRNAEGCAGFFAAGGCGVPLEALKISQGGLMKRIIEDAISKIVNKERHRVGLVCALVKALHVAETDGARRNVADAICQVTSSEEGRAGVVAAGGCGALVEAMKIAEEEDTRGNIAVAI